MEQKNNETEKRKIEGILWRAHDGQMKTHKIDPCDMAVLFAFDFGSEKDVATAQVSCLGRVPEEAFAKHMAGAVLHMFKEMHRDDLTDAAYTMIKFEEALKEEIVGFIMKNLPEIVKEAERDA